MTKEWKQAAQQQLAVDRKQLVLNRTNVLELRIRDAELSARCSRLNLKRSRDEQLLHRLEQTTTTTDRVMLELSKEAHVYTQYTEQLKSIRKQLESLRSDHKQKAEAFIRSSGGAETFTHLQKLEQEEKVHPAFHYLCSIAGFCSIFRD